KLFFTDYGTVAKVERCNMDGTNRTRIVEYKTEQPTTVTLDLVRKLVYWADAYLDFIEVVDYNGKNRQTIIQGNSVRRAQFWVLLLEPKIFMPKRPKLLPDRILV
ncbi:hypothetical protein M9458_044204, partial [Cirrhinus mrigala]